MPALRSEFAEHYRAHFDFTWRNLRRLGVPSTELDDAAQEVFVVLLRRGESIPRELPIRAWLFGVIRRIAWRYRRSDTRRSLLRDAVDRTLNLQPESESAVAGRPDQLHDSREAARLVERFLAELTPIQAEVFILAELEELSGKEIAEHLGVNQNTVWSRLRLARRAFDRRFAPIRAESTRLYQRSASQDRRHPVLSLSRRGHSPSSGDRRRVGALLGIPGFGATPPGTSAPRTSATPGPLEIAATTGTAAPLAGIAGAALVAALAVGVGLSERPRTSATPQEPTSARATQPIAPTLAEERESAIPEDSSAAPPLTPQIPLPSPPKVIAHRSRAPSPGSREPASATTPAPSQPEPPTSDEAPVAQTSELGAEYELIAAARRALNAKDPGRSLALGQAHRRQYPAGILANERDGLRITALCQLGREAEARRLADALTPDLDDPSAILRFLAACPPLQP